MIKVLAAEPLIDALAAAVEMGRAPWFRLDNDKTALPVGGDVTNVFEIGRLELATAAAAFAPVCLKSFAREGKAFYLL